MAHHHTEPVTPTFNIDGLVSQFFNKTQVRKEESQKLEPVELPWESWELDKDFFKALSRYESEHPDSTLDRVLDKIRKGLEESKELVDLIPDSPFPARSLVTALGCLFKLAVTVSHAKKDVQEFAQEVIQWVGQVKSAFESKDKEDGRFTRLSWKNLKDMRQLVNEICSWAFKRLQDGKWSRIGHGITIQSEIQEFNERISSARDLFRDLSAINLAKGLDVIIQNLHLSRPQQDNINETLNMIRATQEKQHGQIMDELESQKLAAERERFLAEALNRHTVADPTYDGQGKRPCDPDTRVEVLAEIDTWINDVSSGSRNFLWLTGDPGCGKSAITASVSKECKKRNILWAQFFINRNNVETTDPNSYFPSIASQLKRRSPAVAEALQNALQKDPTLTDGISADQAAKMFVECIVCASKLDPEPVVVVIDGLDETDRKRLEFTAQIFSTLFTSLKSYSNVKVFISSRTENDIRNSFLHSSHDKYVKRIHLDTADPSSIRDVSHHIKESLLGLVKKHDLNWTIWPGDDRCRMLGERASGLFIWGVTAIKFIQEQLLADGKECLSDVLDMLTANVLDDINSLYTLILKVTSGPRPSEWELERFRRIVGAIVFLQEPLSIDDLTILLDLRKAPSSPPVDIPYFVRRFRTILVTGTEDIDGKTIPRIHKSVFEFVTSDSIDAQFRVESKHAHQELGMQCLSHLSRARASVAEDELTPLFRYASRFWSSHLSQVEVIGAELVCADCRRTPSPSLPSLALGPMVSAEVPIKVEYSATESQIRTTIGDYVMSWDALKGSNLTNHTKPLKCVAFSPDGQHIASGSPDNTIRIWSSTSVRWRHALVEYSSPILSVAFSPDGKTIVSGSENGLLCLWDSSTGTLIGRPFRGHEGSIKCVAFSPDGKHIVSGSQDAKCRLWNAQNGQQVGKPWEGHTRAVTLIAFSASGGRVCSGEFLGYCILWDASTGQMIHSWNNGATPYSLAFSPKNEGIVMIGLQLQPIKILSNGQSSSVPKSDDHRWVSFTPDGEQIISGTRNAISSFAKVDNSWGSIKRVRYNGGIEAESVFAFSPDLRRFAWADTAVHLYALQHNQESLDIKSINDSLPAAQKNSGNDEVTQALYNIKEVRRNNVVTNNRRLDGIKWYHPDSKTDAESDLRILVVMDDAVVAAYKNGSVSVWNDNKRDV